jgi:indole-3-glycerol phosphate synthase/phosphoribosylanthranilate isomerase
MFLDHIVTQTGIDLEQRKRELPLETLQRLAARQPEPRDLLAVLQRKQHVRLIAEVKRASPSKGLLAPHLDPVELARTYEMNGAAAISVLTEPHFFLGSPEHLMAIKQAVSVPVLRKDFIINEYQVYEARAWGADAILLICAILDDIQLRHLLHRAHALGMTCLVEVHSREEAELAVAAGAAVIGVNSRDLVTFQVHPHLIRELRPLIPADRVVVAESGIHHAADARRLARYDIQAMLVGESLVVSQDIPAQMRSLLRGANEDIQVKICGLRTPEHMRTTIAAGADMLGFMFYESSSRYIDPHQARTLLEFVENGSVGDDNEISHPKPVILACHPERSEGSGGRDAKMLRFAQHDMTDGGRENSLSRPSAQSIAPDIVGVFVNKDAAYINEVAQQVGLHSVQLHGDEPPEFCHSITRPVIKALRLQDMADIGRIRAYREVAWRILLDTPAHGWGGSGIIHDWTIARAAAQEAPILLAGGLTPENVAAAIQQVHPWGVDVSSGVETNGYKDISKIRAFIERVRASPAPYGWKEHETGRYM